MYVCPNSVLYSTIIIIYIIIFSVIYFCFFPIFWLRHFKKFSHAITSSRRVPLSSYSWGLLVGSIPTISSYNNTCWSECWLFCEYHECILFQFHSQFYSVHVSYKYGAKNILRHTYSKTISAVFLLGLKPPRFFFCARITVNSPVASLRGGKLF